MKGVLFLVGSTDMAADEAVEQVRRHLARGVFSVRMDKYSNNQMGAIADFLTLRPGDLVFFFSRRLIYGVGSILGKVPWESPAFLTYPSALSGGWPTELPHDEQMVCGMPPHADERIGVAFQPHPVGFADGLDMDDVLASRGSSAAWGLRFMSGKSFFLLTHEEARWLAELFELRLGRNGKSVVSKGTDTGVRACVEKASTGGTLPRLSVRSLVAAEPTRFVQSDGCMKQETTLHGLLLEELAQERPPAALSLPAGVQSAGAFHELWASPPKAAIYADKIDVVHFGRYSPVGASGLPTFFDVFELKRLAVDDSGVEALLIQGMKYVDFVAHQFASNYYHAIRLNFVARAFPPEIKSRVEGICRRQYLVGLREGSGNPNRTWGLVRFVAYRWDSAASRIKFALQEEISLKT